VTTADRCGDDGRLVVAESAANGARNGDAARGIRVLVVADVALRRAGLVELFQSDARVELVGSASLENAAESASLGPDVALVDVDPADHSRAVSTLVAAAPDLKVVVCGVPESEDHVIPCVEAGAAACLSAETPVADIVPTIEHVASGESVASPRMTAMLLQRLAALAAERSSTREGQLTAREREILGLIDDGLSNKDIAARLCIEVPTVKNHVHNILEKLQVGCRSEAAAVLRSNGHAPQPKN
jgi:two-component system nitrate/nitrite response regulator NarL